MPVIQTGFGSILVAHVQDAKRNAILIASSLRPNQGVVIAAKHVPELLSALQSLQGDFDKRKKRVERR